MSNFLPIVRLIVGNYYLIREMVEGKEVSSGIYELNSTVPTKDKSQYPVLEFIRDGEDGYFYVHQRTTMGNPPKWRHVFIDDDQVQAYSPAGANWPNSWVAVSEVSIVELVGHHIKTLDEMLDGQPQARCIEISRGNQKAVIVYNENLGMSDEYCYEVIFFQKGEEETYRKKESEKFRTHDLLLIRLREIFP